MPAHDRGATRLDAYLIRILAAVVKRTKDGELRLPAEAIDGIDENCIVIKDFDSKTGDLVFRTGSRFNEVYRVTPEVPAWQTKPTTSRNLSEIPEPIRPGTAEEDPRVQRTNPNLAQEMREREERLAATLKTNEDLANLEKKFLQQRVAAQVRQELRRQSHQQELMFQKQP